MSVEQLIDPAIEHTILGVELADGADDFIARHEVLVESTRGKLIGVLTLGEAIKDNELKDRFGTDYDRLNEDQHTFLTKPHDEEIQELRGAFLAERTLLTAVKALDGQRQTRERTANEEDIPHQQQILDDILGPLSEGKKEGNVVLATAGGKTYLEAKLADIFVRAGLRVLILASTKQIGNQIIGENGKKGLSQFATPAVNTKVGKQFGGTKAKPTDQLVVSTYQSFNRFANDDSLGDFDVVLCDEAHRALGEVTSKNVKVAFPHAVKIGFTATPDFGVNKSVSQILPETFHSLDLREAIDSGITANMQCLVYGTGEEIVLLNPRHKDFTDWEIKRLINLKSRNEKALQFAEDFVNDGRQGIIACVPGENLAHARLLAAELEQRDVVDKHTGETRKIKAKAIGSSIVSDQQLHDILEQYAAGDIDVLTFVGILGEGWDSKKASFLINACPTTSIVKITQQIGRVIRKKDDGLQSIVVDFVDDVVGKEQKTALHALGEDTIDINKVYGPRYPKGEELGADTYLRGILNPYLYDQLMFVNGRLVADLTLSTKEHQLLRTFDYYERLLQKEGLTQDTHLFGIPPNELSVVGDAEDEFLAKNGREPTVDELIEGIDGAQYLGSKFEDKQKARLNNILMTRDFDLRGTMIGNTEVVDDSHDDLPYGDPQEEVWRLMIRGDLKGALSELNEREQRVLNLRFGLSGHDTKTFDEVGQEFSLTRERIRQIESKALAKLRHPRRSRILRGYAGYAGELSQARHGEDLVDTYTVEVIRKMTDEPLGLQSLMLNVLPPAERKKLLEKHGNLFSKPIRDYLLYVVNNEAQEEGDSNIEPTASYSLNIMHKDIKRLVAGEYNDFLTQVPSYLREDIVRFVGTIDRPLLYDKRATPQSLLDLKGHVASTKQSEAFGNMLLRLRRANLITNNLVEIHSKIQATQPEHVVPDRKDLGVYYSWSNTRNAYPIKSLARIWKLPQVTTFANDLIQLSSYQGVPYGLSHSAQGVTINIGQVQSFLAAFRKTYQLTD